MKNVINTERAPAAIGPYSQAITVGNMIFTSGQIPLDPGTMDVVSGGIREQTAQVLSNLEAVLDFAGASVRSIVKTTVFLRDMNDFQEFNHVYAEFLQGAFPPARSCVQVARLPKDVMVEVEAIAILDSK